MSDWDAKIRHLLMLKQIAMQKHVTPGVDESGQMGSSLEANLPSRADSQRDNSSTMRFGMNGGNFQDKEDDNVCDGMMIDCEVNIHEGDEEIREPAQYPGRVNLAHNDNFFRIKEEVMENEADNVESNANLLYPEEKISGDLFPPTEEVKPKKRKRIRKPGPKKFACQDCDKCFSSFTALRNHCLTHIGLKPSVCDECGARFTTQYQLARHVKYRHTNEKTQQCRLCDYTCVEKGDLRRHMMRHTKERPHQCDQCSYAASGKRHL